MADLFGAMEVPVQVPAPGATVSDPGLDYLAAYLKAYLTYQGQSAWNAVAPGEPIVRTTHTHNPTEADVNLGEAPALYVWRQPSKHETLADGYQIKTTPIRILWLFPPAQQQHAAKRTPILNAIDNLIREAIHRERHVSYIVPGDTDTGAPTRGSNVPRFCRFMRWDFKGSGVQDIPIAPLPGGPQLENTPGVVAELEVVERLWFDPTIEGETYTIEGTTEFSSVDTDDRTEFKSG